MGEVAKGKFFGGGSMGGNSMYEEVDVLVADSQRIQGGDRT